MQATGAGSPPASKSSTITTSATRAREPVGAGDSGAHLVLRSPFASLRKPQAGGTLALPPPSQERHVLREPDRGPIRLRGRDDSGQWFRSYGDENWEFSPIWACRIKPLRR